MKTEVVFHEGRPSADMTRDEVVTWLLGSLGPMTLGSGIVASWGVSSLVDGLKDGAEVPVETGYGRYVLTVTTARRRLRWIRTYHAEER
jgi:hypothetical protein